MAFVKLLTETTGVDDDDDRCCQLL